MNSSTLLRLLLILLLLLSQLELKAGIFYVIAAPSELQYKGDSTNVWKKVKSGDVLKGGNIKFPVRTYLLLLHSSGKIYSDDTSGIINIGMLEESLTKVEKQPVSYKIILDALNYAESNKTHILNFKEHIYRCRCFSSIVLYGEDENTYIRSAGGTLAWTNKLKENTRFEFTIRNFFDDVLYKKEISSEEPIFINNEMIRQIRYESPQSLIAKISNDRGDEGSITFKLMESEKEKEYINTLVSLENEYSDHSSWQFLICKLLLENQNRLLLECGESYKNLYKAISERYEDYNTEYFDDLAGERMSLHGTVKDTKKTIITIQVQEYAYKPKIGSTIKLVQHSYHNYKIDVNFLGQGIVKEYSDEQIVIELTKVYSELITRTNERLPAVFVKDEVSLVWEE